MESNIVTIPRADYDRMVRDLQELKKTTALRIYEDQHIGGGRTITFNSTGVDFTTYRKSRMSRIRQMASLLGDRENRLAEVDKKYIKLTQEISILESKYGWLLKLWGIHKE